MRNATAIATLLMVACTAFAADTDKTLVSWVALADGNVRAGSILTVQHGPEFDGIVFAEKDPGKWMAGSDFFKRTQKDRSKTAIETADSETQVQMAIVYEGDEIKIFRNGELYSRYAAKNIDLLSSGDSIAVFGLRHIGGDGSIAGAIDDARIYGKALTVDEIRALRPNQPSTVKPVAWWDFEGDKIVDRAGRFGYHTLDGGAELHGGKLVLRRDSALVAATTEAGASVSRRSAGQVTFTGPYVPETPAWPEDPPANWLTYHLAHPGPGNAMPGDPNPAFFWKGRYHLHYIYRNRTGFVFAHVSSDDMVHWKWHPTVLGPRTTGHGMFSGTGFITKDGRAAMVYHGQGSGRNWIAYALDDDMDTWSPPEVMLPNDTNGNPVTSMPYFDPDIWINNGTYYGLNGRSSRESAVIMKSENLKDWTYIGELLHPDFDEETLGVKRDEDISCPNMFRLATPAAGPAAGKWMLLCISHRLGCRYFIGDFKNERYLPEFHAMMSWNGNQYFAPESLLTPDGRRVMWAWLLRMPIAPTGVQALPRELELPPDGVLRIRPLRELRTLRRDPRTWRDITVKDDAEQALSDITGDALELEITFAAPLPEAAGLHLLGDADGADGMSIIAGATRETLAIGATHPPFALKTGEDLTLRVFIDKNLVEVFANDRQAAVYAHPHVRKTPNIRLFATGGDAVVKSVKAWQMQSIHECSRPGR